MNHRIAFYLLVTAWVSPWVPGFGLAAVDGAGISCRAVVEIPSGKRVFGNTYDIRRFPRSGANSKRGAQWLEGESRAAIAGGEVSESTEPAAPRPPDWKQAIESLAGEERTEWEHYLKKSESLQSHQREVPGRELKAGGKPVPAPSGGTFKWDRKKIVPGSAEARELADVILSYQLPCGGWSKAVDYSKGPRVAGMAWTSQRDPWHYAATLDNRATTGQLEFLAAQHGAAPEARLADAIRRGVQWLLDARFPSGGWPQVFPLEGGYHDAITLNDGAMLHAMEILTLVQEGREGFGFLSPELRDAAGRAVKMGHRCLLRCQLVRDGIPSVWCAQHDPVTLAPAGGRAYEPASLSGAESGDIVRHLMTLPNPDKETAAAIEGALAWFEAVKLPGAQPGDPPRWARFYDLKTHTPIFQGRKDHLIYRDYAAMARNNPGGYDYFTEGPNDLTGKWAERWRRKQGGR